MAAESSLLAAFSGAAFFSAAALAFAKIWCIQAHCEIKKTYEEYCWVEYYCWPSAAAAFFASASSARLAAADYFAKVKKMSPIKIMHVFENYDSLPSAAAFFFASAAILIDW